MYEKIVDQNPYETPMMIYPAVHYTMGGIWVDYNLMTTVPGLYAIGEANFSDHGANRLGASALMQGLADGYFVLPYTIGDYLSKEISALRKDFWKNVKVPGSQDEFNEELAKAGRVADFLELGELFAKDALDREESCGGHFREEHQTKEGEATRKKEFQFVSAWEYVGEPKNAILHKEELKYKNIEVKERSYK